MVEAVVGSKCEPAVCAALLAVHIDFEAVRAGSIEVEVKVCGSYAGAGCPLYVVLGCVTGTGCIEGPIKSTPDEVMYCAAGVGTAVLNVGDSTVEVVSVTETGVAVVDTGSMTYLYLISLELAGTVVEVHEGMTIDSHALKKCRVAADCCALVWYVVLPVSVD